MGKYLRVEDKFKSKIMLNNVPQERKSKLEIQTFRVAIVFLNFINILAEKNVNPK